MSGEQWFYFPLTFHLEAPAIFTRPGGDPNSAYTCPYIPGGVIRGLLAGKAAKSHTFRSDFLDGSCRFLNAYLKCGGRRMTPLPLSWHRLKCRDAEPPEQVNVWDALQAPITQDHEPLEFGFAFPGVTRYVDDPKLLMSLHVQRDPDKGRAWTERKNGKETEHGAIYHYEALDREQTFVGAIQLKAEGEKAAQSCFDNHFGAHLKDTVRFGRARTAMYGANARVETPERPVSREWAGIRERRGDIQIDECVTMLLTAPCLVRDGATGQIDPGVFRSEVLRVFENKVTVETAFLDTEITGGFNRKWGLELPQARAVKAGSVLRLKAAEAIDEATWLKLEHDGIGERLPEGFGRFLLLEPGASTFRVNLVTHAPMPEPADVSPRSISMQEELLLEAGQHELRDRAARVADVATALPGNSLLGRVRMQLRRTPCGSLHNLVPWLDGIKSKRAGDALDACKIHLRGDTINHDLHSLLRHIAGEQAQDAIKRTMGLSGVLPAVRLIPQQQAEAAQQELMPRLRHYFIDAILAAMQHKNRENRS